jgi:carbon-monoxide dehydrogenase medium subunit
MEIAVVGAAALVVLDADGRCADVRIALTAVAPTCLRAGAAEAALSGAEPTADALAEAGRLSADAASPIDDVRAPADYRRAMVPVIVRRALEGALARARGEER